jgi:hypothetical protein
MDARRAAHEPPEQHSSAGALWWRDPPECPDGWVTGPPEFVGVGAQRCGTSWWFAQIAAHPRVFFEPPVHVKEVHFLEYTRHFRRLPEHYADLYAQHFPRPPGAGVIGEWTPRYMFDPWAVGQLRQLAPGSRVLLLLRDPVARYASGYARELRLARQRGVSQLPEDVIEDQVARGLYCRQVQRVLDAFPRESVLILQYERCRASYGEELDRTYRFLGLEPGFRPEGPSNPPVRRPPRGFLHTARGRVLAEAYADDVARLAEIAPEIDISLWPSVRDLV